VQGLLSRRWKIIASYGIKSLGIFLFLLLFLHTLNWRDFSLALQNVSGLEILCAVVLLMGIQSLKAWRWQHFSGLAGLRLPYGESWKMYHASLFLGLSTPGKIGELIRMEYLRANHVPRAIGFSLIILERVLDLLAVCALSIGAVGYLYGLQWSMLSLVAFLCLLGVCRLFLKGLAPPSLTSKLLSRTSLTISMITVLIWFLSVIWAMFIARSVGITAPPLAILSAFPISCLVAILPITIAGLGTRDTAMFFLLRPFGVPAAETIAYSFSMFFLLLLGSLPGGWFWIRMKMGWESSDPLSPVT
jgi:uncharacterized membrane protein YbhN (UPF0104 family)